MALFKSQILTQASGSVGGTTFAHAKGGMYMRARAMPVNPNTALQGNARTALTAAVNRWSTVLTPTQRAGWDLYAANVSVTNRLGDAVFLSGQNMYIRTNQVLGYAAASGIGSVNSAWNPPPTEFNLGNFTTPSLITADAVTGLSLTFTNSDEWANDDNGMMLLYMGRPTSVTRNYFKGPWRLVQTILGDSMTPPTSPSTVNLADTIARAFPLITGSRVYFEVQVVQPDGRLSTRRRLPAVEVTP